MEEKNNVKIREIKAGDVGWILQNYGGIYTQEFGWDVDTMEFFVINILQDYIRKRSLTKTSGWMAEVNNKIVGCVLLCKENATTGRLRLLFVSPDGRGYGIGSKLVEQCIEFSKACQFTKIILYTTSVQTDAIRLYEKFGWRVIKSKTINTFGPNMEEQEFELILD